MHIDCALGIKFLMVLSSINSQELFEIAATDFTPNIAATHRVLVRPLEDPWRI
jgi:hypothetical protein